jgi:Protein of unknown function (DUF3563)
MQTRQLSLTNPAVLGVFPLLAKALAFPARQADALGHREAIAASASATTPVRRRGFLERLERWFWAQQQRDLEAYLARATDVYDLEARIHALERSKSIPYY